MLLTVPGLQAILAVQSQADAAMPYPEFRAVCYLAQVIPSARL